MLRGFKSLILEIICGLVLVLLVIFALRIVLLNSSFKPLRNNFNDPLLSTKAPNDFMRLEKEASPPASVTVPILIYHYVSYPTDLSDTVRMGLSVGSENFASQAAYLYTNGYKTITLSDLVDTLKYGRKKLPEKSIILTFDDGYRDFYTNVFPILRKYNFKAVSFVIYNSMGLWGNLTKDQIKEMTDSGLVEIGAHTISHVSLTSISPDKAEKEIVESKTRLEQELGVPVRYFSYPSGFYNEKIEEIVKENFKAGVSTRKGKVHTLSTIYTLDRIKVGNWNAEIFAKKIWE